MLEPENSLKQAVYKAGKLVKFKDFINQETIVQKCRLKVYPKGKVRKYIKLQR